MRKYETLPHSSLLRGESVSQATTRCSAHIEAKKALDIFGPDDYPKDAAFVGSVVHLFPRGASSIFHPFGPPIWTPDPTASIPSR